jgi:hypothetical protein
MMISVVRIALCMVNTSEAAVERQSTPHLGKHRHDSSRPFVAMEHSGHLPPIA